VYRVIAFILQFQQSLNDPDHFPDIKKMVGISSKKIRNKKHLQGFENLEGV
jgi:hypothetical protein